MKHRRSNLIAGLSIGLAIVVIAQFILWTDAFGQSNRWTLPYRLSTGKGKAMEATLISDEYGYVHALWTEDLPNDTTNIQYARFDGESWTFPIDIYVSTPFVGIGSVSAAIDQDGILHIIWTEGLSGPAYYKNAPVYSAFSAANWAKPQRILIPADSAILKIDSQDVFHLLYVKFLGEQQGIYYMRSTNKGFTWSVPVWLDQDVPEDHGPRSLHFSLDENDGLHASWYYVPRSDIGGNWVRYIHSLDGGQNWSTPYTIDIVADDNSGLQSAGPVMIVQGSTVHIIWGAGDEFFFRNHRFSRDAGQTWSPKARIMGELNGQAFDGMAIDGAGRVHFFAQLRFPQGIYHTYWDSDHWTTPSLVYLIRATGDEPIIDQIHAHHTHAAVRAGNQLVLTFNDPPPQANRRLFTMNLKLDDVPETQPEPTPVLATESVEEISPELGPTLTPTARTLNFDPNASVTDLPSPISPIWIGFLPTVALLCGLIVYLGFIKGRR